MSGVRSADAPARCAGEPVSWLRLEGFHLGEIQGAERARIAEHLAACGACAACLARIREDDAVPLPPLVVARPARGPARAISPAWAAASLGALAAAAALVAGVRGAARRGAAGDAIARAGRVKGGAIAFTLVRDDGARIDGPAGVYRDGDRFKAVVTCPPGGAAAFDVVVREGGRASFPLAPAIGLACGNDVPLPGAFRLTGAADESVCLVWSEEGPVDRASLDADGPASLCKRLAPVTGP